MAMPAGLIAFATDIDLESLQRATSQGQAVTAQLLIKCIRAHVWCQSPVPIVELGLLLFIGL